MARYVSLVLAFFAATLLLSAPAVRGICIPIRGPAGGTIVRPAPGEMGAGGTLHFRILAEL